MYGLCRVSESFVCWLDVRRTAHGSARRAFPFWTTRLLNWLLGKAFSYRTRERISHLIRVCSLSKILSFQIILPASRASAVVTGLKAMTRSLLGRLPPPTEVSSFETISTSICIAGERTCLPTRRVLVWPRRWQTRAKLLSRGTLSNGPRNRAQIGGIPDEVEKPGFVPQVPLHRRQAVPHHVAQALPRNNLWCQTFETKSIPVVGARRRFHSIISSYSYSTRKVSVGKGLFLSNRSTL